MHLSPKGWVQLSKVNRAFRALFSHLPLWRRLLLARGSRLGHLDGAPREDPATRGRDEVEVTDWRGLCLLEWATDKWRRAAGGCWRQRRLEGHQGAILFAPPPASSYHYSRPFIWWGRVGAGRAAAPALRHQWCPRWASER